MPGKTKQLAVLIAVLVALTAFPQQALACLCVPPGSPADELDRSTVVFAGKVMGMEIPSGQITSSADPVRVTFRVYTVWKGPSRDMLAITTARSTVSCGYEFEAGREYLVHTYGGEDDLHVSLCSRTRPLAVAASDLASLGRGDGIEMGGEVGTWKYLISVAVVIALGVALGLGALLSRWARARR